MGGTVKSVPPYSVLLVHFVRQPVQVGVGGQGVVKARVEDRHVRSKGKCLPCKPNAQDIDRIVQGGEVAQRFNSSSHLVGNQHGVSEALTAVHHTMPHCCNVCGRSNMFSFGQRFNHGRKGCRVILSVEIYESALPVVEPMKRGVGTDPLHDSQNLLGRFFRVKKTVLEG
jgi:hypothetical protein